jgi:hypothetical protein
LCRQEEILLSLLCQPALLVGLVSAPISFVCVATPQLLLPVQLILLLVCPKLLSRGPLPAATLLNLLLLLLLFLLGSVLPRHARTLTVLSQPAVHSRLTGAAGGAELTMPVLLLLLLDSA